MDNSENMTYDYRLYDQVWQRVAPELNPYPEVRSGEATPFTEALPTRTHTDTSQDTFRDLIDEEWEGRRVYLAYACHAPNNQARRIMRQLAEEEYRHAKRLASLYYLMTGQCYKPLSSGNCIAVPTWCKALRQRYHEELFDAGRYEQLAHESKDDELSHILQELSSDEKRHARQLLCLLEQNMLA